MWTLCAPSKADWCVMVIGGRPGETDYWYEYVKGERPEVDELCLFLPAGWEMLEYDVGPTRHGDYADCEPLVG